MIPHRTECPFTSCLIVYTKQTIHSNFNGTLLLLSTHNTVLYAPCSCPSLPPIAVIKHWQKCHGGRKGSLYIYIPGQSITGESHTGTQGHALPACSAFLLNQDHLSRSSTKAAWVPLPTTNQENATHVCQHAMWQSHFLSWGSSSHWTLARTSHKNKSSSSPTNFC